MILRASFREQDAEVTTSETTVQLRSARSTVKHLVVRPVPPAAIADVIRHEHYLHSMPTAPCLCFGIFRNDDLLGAVVFTAGARHGYRLLQAARPQEVVTLARLWLSDGCPKNSESRVIGVVLRHLRRQSHWKLLLSYADPSVGHVGTIYQATGWLYLGRGAPSSYLDMGDGRLQHPRSVYERYGSNAVRHLRHTGIPAIRRYLPGKHRYAYVLDPAWHWRLAAQTHPYPRKAHGDGISCSVIST